MHTLQSLPLPHLLFIQSRLNALNAMNQLDHIQMLLLLIYLFNWPFPSTNNTHTNIHSTQLSVDWRIWKWFTFSQFHAAQAISYDAHSINIHLLTQPCNDTCQWSLLWNWHLYWIVEHHKMMLTKWIKYPNLILIHSWENFFLSCNFNVISGR